MNSFWVGTDPAADYLGIGWTKLHEFTLEERIPLRCLDT